MSERKLWRPPNWDRVVDEAYPDWREDIEEKRIINDFEVGADAMLEGLVVWGNEHCPHFEHLGESIAFKKHSCPYCWEALLGEVEDEV